MNRKLLKNKIYASMIMLLGVVSVFVIDDTTFFIFTLVVGLGMFVSKKNCIC